MNYVSVVYAVVVVLLLMDWFIRGRRSYQGVQNAPEHEHEQPTETGGEVPK